MFHGRKRLNAHNSEDENGKGNLNKTYSKKKARSKPSLSKKNNWGNRFGNHTYRHGSYESDFVGTKRLTNCAGFLAKGKISDSISRLEKSMPEIVKVRTEQDLLKILQQSKESKVATQSVASERSKPNDTSSENRIPFSSPCNSYQSPPEIQSSVCRNRFAYSHNAPDSKFSAVIKPPESISDDKKREFALCKDLILNGMHSVATKTNETLFPGVSNLNRLKEEFIHLRNEFNSFRHTLSSSNNCESSQETSIHNNNEAFTKESFQLNPVLTQETPLQRSLESMFPSSEDLSSDSDIQIIDVPELLRKTVPPCPIYKSESTSSSERMIGSHSLILCSSASSSDSPVWKLDVSPVRFIPNLPPTPRLYYRQKMF